MKHVKRYKGLIERIFWLINLRWVAIAGVCFTVFFVHSIFRIPLPVTRIYVVIAFLTAYNIIALAALKHLKRERPGYIAAAANRIANLQISLDLVCLTALIHFSGGVDNPFIFYFIFHVIIASILLSRLASFLQATLAIVLFCSIIFLEYLSVIPHYGLKIFGDHGLYNNLFYISGISFVFTSTLYISVYMATSISARLRRREKNLKEANELLAGKDRAKSRYVLRVTHDIKEHLAAIQGCIEPVTGGFVGPLNAKQMDMLLRANERTGKLLFFIRALLELSSIKLNEHAKRQPFSVSETVKNAVACVRPRAEHKGVILTSRVDASIGNIKGVQTYIEETISNILANAIKYTHKNGRVDLEVKDEGRTILIQIKDTGIGIPGDALPRIFDDFYRADNARKVEIDGSGLGLSIAKEVAERHNGKIWAASEEGRGSSFFIRLPK
ncbi:MAG: HAMP domain-containing sensor histidine kinase [Candidatus Omnitrophota bacterium]